MAALAEEYHRLAKRGGQFASAAADPTARIQRLNAELREVVARQPPPGGGPRAARGG